MWKKYKVTFTGSDPDIYVTVDPSTDIRDQLELMHALNQVNGFAIKTIEPVGLFDDIHGECGAVNHYMKLD